jgi:hypothetical protein
MTKILGRIAAVVAVLGFLAAPAAAQIHDNAVFGAMPGTGVTVSGDFALAVSDDAKIGGENPLYAGGRIQIGLPMFGVWAGAGVSPLGIDGADKNLGFGGGAGVHVLNAPMMPVSVSIQAGVGYLSATGGNLLNFVGGPMITINVPSAGVAVKPWIYPRVQYQKITDVDGELGFGASGGLMVTMPMGLGFQASVDFLSIKYGDFERESQMRAAFGAHYKIVVPSLGM